MAEIVVIVTDMGNGGAFCNVCNCDLDHGNPLNEIPPQCPQCGETFTSRSEPYINMGGSDF